MKVFTFNDINYQYKREFRKWLFAFGDSSMLVPCHGQENAHKVARVINGALKRQGKLDNLARYNISVVCGMV